MAEINLTQAEADALLAMVKRRENDGSHLFPRRGEKISLPLQSDDGRELFLLDLRRGRVELRQVTMRNRARQVVIRARLDLFGPPHRNPDGEEIPTPHLHLYREDYGDKWAVPLPADYFLSPNDEWKTLNDFMGYCNITEVPNIQRMLIA